MNIIIIGANGLIGSLATDRFLQCGVAINTMLRSSISDSRPGLTVHVAAPSAWPDMVKTIRPDIAISALGTTIRQAGSQAAFQAVDFDMIVDFGSAAREAGARQMIVVSSVGADAASSNFYLRTKGRTEESLRAMNFARLDIVRPGLLLGTRAGPPRTGERIGAMISPALNLILRGPLDRYGAIEADCVAAAIVAMARETAPGVFVHENRALRRMANASGA